MAYFDSYQAPVPWQVDDRPLTQPGSARRQDPLNSSQSLFQAQFDVNPTSYVVHDWMPGPFAAGDYGPVLDPIAAHILGAQIRINPLLQVQIPEHGAYGTELKWDMLEVAPPFPPGRLLEPATFPRVSSLRLVSASFPWTIEIRGNPNVAVTCEDIIERIKKDMLKLVDKSFYDAISTKWARRVVNSYRYNQIPGVQARGLNRSDFLISDTTFAGIVSDPSLAEKICGKGLMRPCTFVLMRRPRVSAVVQRPISEGWQQLAEESHRVPLYNDTGELYDQPGTSYSSTNRNAVHELESERPSTSNHVLTWKTPADASEFFQETNFAIQLEAVVNTIRHVFGEILSDKVRYRALLQYRDATAQKILDVLQMLLDYPQLDAPLKTRLLSVLLTLSKKSHLYPKCFTLNAIKVSETPITAGSFGEIWKGGFRGQSVCLKVVKIYERSSVEHLLTAFSKEAMVWGQLSHPNLLPFYGIYHLKDAHGRICLVSPWMDNGNILEYLIKKSDANRALLIAEIISGISYLHSEGIIHGDLKGVNILITASGNACVADFGLATVSDDAEIAKWTSIATTVRGGGTIRWQAPEMFDAEDEDQRATKASDIYAFSCVCYEIYTGRLPFYQIRQDANVIYKVMRGDRPEHPGNDIPSSVENGLTDNIWGMMEDCWQTEPSKRLTATEVATQLPVRFLENNVRLSDLENLAPSRFRTSVHDDTGGFSLAELDETLSLLRKLP